MNQRGSALIQALIAGGLLAGTALGFSSLFKDSFEFSQRVQRIVDVTQKISEMNMILGSSSACEKSLSGILLVNGQNVVVKNPAGTGNFLQLGRESVKGSDVKTLRLKDVTVDSHDNATVMATLEMTYVMGSEGDNQARSKEFLLSVRRNVATNTIVSCVSNESYVRGGVYGGCAMEFGPDFKTLKASAPVWPVVQCKNPTVCADGFSTVTLAFSQGNTTASGALNPANDYYWGQTACVKN